MYESRPTRAEISLSSIKHNLVQVKNKVGSNVKIMGVVKANAYGHGILDVSKFLVGQSLVDYLGVAYLEEGIEIRKSGIDFPIHSFTHLFEDQISSFVDFKIEPTIADFSIAQKLNNYCSKLNYKFPIHIKIDTGMGRIGIIPKESLDFINALKDLSNLKIQGIFSHFATSDETDQTFANEQLKLFSDIRRNLIFPEKEKPIFHLANSAAIISMRDTYFDMVRSGIMMYGYAPSDELNSQIDLKPALSLKSKVAFLKTVSPETSISYGRRYFTKNETKIATIPFGYADGFYRLLTNKGEVIINHKKYPVAGTVCMDQIMVDVFNDEINVNDEVIIIGKDNDVCISAIDVAKKIPTIPYEVCCSISQRVPRIYLK